MTKEEIISYSNGIGVTGEQLQWVNTTLLKWLKENEDHSQKEIEHLLDYLASSDAPLKMIRMSYEQASKKAIAWSKTQQKKGAHIKEEAKDTKTIFTFSDGARIAELKGENAFKREGFLMRHCAGGLSKSGDTIYSYRDKNNMPHATFQVSKQGKDIMQVKGKGNGPIHPKYINPIIKFLEHLGLPVRDEEMKNIGYYFLPEEIKSMVNQFIPAPIGIMLNEKFYAYGEQR